MNEHEGLLPITRFKWESLQQYEQYLDTIQPGQYIQVPVMKSTRPNNQLLYRDIYLMIAKKLGNQRVSYRFKLRGVYAKTGEHLGIQVYCVN